MIIHPLEIYPYTFLQFFFFCITCLCMCVWIWGCFTLAEDAWLKLHEDVLATLRAQNNLLVSLRKKQEEYVRKEDLKEMKEQIERKSPKPFLPLQIRLWRHWRRKKLKMMTHVHNSLRPSWKNLGKVLNSEIHQTILAHISTRVCNYQSSPYVLRCFT